MSSSLPSPHDFVVDYTPSQTAALELWVVDERPPAPFSLRGIARRARSLLQGRPADLRGTNDAEAERAWETMDARWRNRSPETFATFLAEKFSNDDLRKFEYPFLARCLTRRDVRTDLIVDMGGGNSYSTVVPIVLQLPNSRVLSVDVVNHTATSKYNVEYVRGDCINTNLPAGCADVVALISTLEHVGLGRWGDPLDVDGDVKAMREAWRILRPGGHVVLTIPYGYPTVVFNLHRIYDQGRIRLLARDFDTVEAEYTLRGKSATREEVEGVKVTPSAPGHRGAKRPDAAAPQIAGGGMFLFRKPARD